ncbi:hypothetical protein COCVIDRAFT_64178, partial [Bipolaris victoriae FI3]
PLLPDSIRLLRLLPSEDETAPIQCELFHYSLQESGRRTHPYEALSYVWGRADNPQSIFVREHDPTSGNGLPVTQNLHAALARLRYSLFERIIWIDAVCINQNDDREREQQIQFMAKIYALANRVIVWLGEVAEDSDQALHWIRAAGGTMPQIPLCDGMSQQAVTALLQRPWFRRIWVLQEVAAARHILVMCGSMEIDGCAFALGIDSFQRFDDVRAGLQSLTSSVTYLIRGSIFRSSFSMSRSGRYSLDICPLGELVDLYRAHEATKSHDRVFALLGMSSDDLSKSRLLPDYTVSWEELLKRLTKYLLCEEISVEILGVGREIAVIKGKGFVLGKVLFVQSNAVQNERVNVHVIFKNGEISDSLPLQTSTTSVRDGDIICLLQGASNPTIIRQRQDHFEVIAIAARPLTEIPVIAGSIDWSTFLQLEILFIHDLVLVWDWEISLDKSQHPERYDRVLQCSTELHGPLERATRIWTVARVLADVRKSKKARKRLQEAVMGYETAFGIQHSDKLETEYDLTPLSWAAKNGHDAVVRLLLAKDDVDPDMKDSQSNRTPLSWAAEKGHEAIFQLLLDTGNVEIDSKDAFRRTPLSWAAEGGHETIVQLLLSKDDVDPGLEDVSGWTPLSWAAEKGHATIVNLLLST